MRRLTRILFLFLLLCAGFSVYAGNNVANWKVGVAKSKITPEQNIWMAGYAARTEPSKGILHDLWAKALFIEDSLGNAALLVTTDLLGIPKEMSDQIRNAIYDEMGLSRSQIILSSSHTHSGPVLTNSLRSIYPVDDKQNAIINNYTDGLIEKIIDLAKKAREKASVTAVYAKNGVVRFQVNRRNNEASKLTDLVELEGPNDYAVPVIKVENQQGEVEAIVFGYACHPTVLNGYKLSGDYPGFAQLQLEKKYKGAVAMFFQGAGADQNPLPRRSVPLAKQYGMELAAAVERVLSEEMTPLQSHLTTAYSEVDLPLNNPPSEKELEKIIDNSKSYIKSWAVNLQDKIKKGQQIPESYPYPVQFWQLGNQKIVSLGGELLSGYSIGLKKILGNDIFVMGYANDVMAYIPTEQVLFEGGYEGETSQMVYGMPATWKKGLEEIIISQAVELVNQAVPGEHFKKDESRDHLVASKYFSGFPKAHDSYNSISSAGDGKIYYVLSSQEYDKAGQMYVFDPDLGKTRWLADLDEICGEKGKNAISQGKSHTRFYECDDKLYFSTHVGYYEMIDGMERLPVHAPDGYKLYPGGHFLSYDLKKGTFENLAVAPEGEGIITMIMDKERKQLYGITWPVGYFIQYDLNEHVLHNYGKIDSNGEAGKVGDDYRVLCRSMFVDDRDGKVYYSTSRGDIFYFDPELKAVRKIEGVDLRLDYFGKYDYKHPGNMAYNWRSIVWEPYEDVAYGVHGNSGYLFRFDPRQKTVEIVDRITSESSRKSGMFDQFSYGYLGFDLGPDKRTLYYLTGGPIYVDGKRVKGVDEIAMGAARGLENLHLITYYIPTGKYKDHGPVFYSDGSRPTYVNSIALDKNGNVYTLARFENEGKEIADLIQIPNPFKMK